MVLSLTPRTIFIHAHLLSVYKEVPEWWYLTTFGVINIRCGAPSSVYGLLYSPLSLVRLLKFMVIVRIRVLNIYPHCPHWHDSGLLWTSKMSLTSLHGLLFGYALLATRLRCIFSNCFLTNVNWMSGRQDKRHQLGRQTHGIGSLSWSRLVSGGRLIAGLVVGLGVVCFVN